MGKNLKVKTMGTLLTLAGISLVGLGRPADATETSYSLFNTGVNSVGSTVTGADSHYSIFRVPYASVPGTNDNPKLLSVTTAANTCSTPLPAGCVDTSLFDRVYLNNGTTTTSAQAYNGQYIFETTFTIPANETIKYLAGQWLSYPGSTGVSVTLNPTVAGTSIFNNTITGGTTISSTPTSNQWAPFQFNSGFNQGGVNTLFFTINKTGRLTSTSAGLQVNNLRVPVPFEFDAKEGFLLGIPLFIGLRQLKKKRATA